MAGPRSSKRDIDRAKREKQAAKREKRAQGAGPEDATADGPVDGPMAESDVLQALADLHARFEAKQLDFDAYEEAKADLLGRLG